MAPVSCCLVVISLCPNSSTSLYLSLHICAARLLPLRLWPAWRLHFTEQARPIPLHFPHHQGPSCRASTQCSSRTATISFYFDRTAQSFTASFHWLSTWPIISPNAIISMLLSSTHCTLVDVSIRSNAPLALFSLYPCLVCKVTARAAKSVRSGSIKSTGEVGELYEAGWPLD